MELHGRLDVVVNNAGGSPYALAAEASALPSEGHRTEPARHAQRPLAANAGDAATGVGRIYHLDLQRERPSAIPGTPHAAAAPASTASPRHWRSRHRRSNNAVVAGMVATEQGRTFYGDSDSQAAVAATVPSAVSYRPDERSATTVFLASDAASHISGVTAARTVVGEPPPYLSASGANTKETDGVARRTGGHRDRRRGRIGWRMRWPRAEGARVVVNDIESA